MIVLQKVTYARLSPNGYARFFQRPHIAVNGAQADTKPVGEFLRPHHALGLQVDENGGEAVDSVHTGSKISDHSCFLRGKDRIFGVEVDLPDDITRPDYSRNVPLVDPVIPLNYGQNHHH